MVESLNVRLVATAAAVLIGVSVAACEKSEPEPAVDVPAVLTDSSREFAGEKRQVAQVVEDFEATVRRGQQGRLCRQVGAPRGESFGLPAKDALKQCLESAELAPQLELDTLVNGRYDLIVRRVTIDEKKEKFAPDAVALVEMPEGAPNDRERFALKLVANKWKLAERKVVGAQDRRGPYVIECDDGQKPKSWTTDVFLGGRGGRPLSARDVLTDEAGRPRVGLATPKELQGTVRAAGPAELVRTSISYAYGGVNYELRAPDGETHAHFDVVPFDGHYALWRAEACPQDQAPAPSVE